MTILKRCMGVMATARFAVMVLAALAFWILLFPSLVSWLVPARLWLDVRGVVVHDGPDGATLRVVPDRTIHAGPFGLWADGWKGSWQTVIRRETTTGFLPVCAQEMPPPAPRRFLPGERVPENPDMAWWLEVPPNYPCDWQPGTYRGETRWYVYPLPGVPWLRIASDRVFYTFAVTDEPG